jgi:maltose alpha-D-glucosyltransferase/alpha-amylase
VQIELALDRRRGSKLVNLLTGDHSEANRRGRHRIVMEPYGYHWYRMGGLGYLLDRTDA